MNDHGGVLLRPLGLGRSLLGIVGRRVRALVGGGGLSSPEAPSYSTEANVQWVWLRLRQQQQLN